LLRSQALFNARCTILCHSTPRTRRHRLASFTRRAKYQRDQVAADACADASTVSSSISDPPAAAIGQLQHPAGGVADPNSSASHRIALVALPARDIEMPGSPVISLIRSLQPSPAIAVLTTFLPSDLKPRSAAGQGRGLTLLAVDHQRAGSHIRINSPSRWAARRFDRDQEVIGVARKALARRSSSLSSGSK